MKKYKYFLITSMLIGLTACGGGNSGGSAESMQEESQDDSQDDSIDDTQDNNDDSGAGQTSLNVPDNYNFDSSKQILLNIGDNSVNCSMVVYELPPEISESSYVPKSSDIILESEKVGPCKTEMLLNIKLNSSKALVVFNGSKKQIINLTKE